MIEAKKKERALRPKSPKAKGSGTKSKPKSKSKKEPAELDVRSKEGMV
jgi:hypothetical protein